MILALDTATRATAVALDNAELRDDLPPGARPRHTTRLLAMIAELMDRTGASWEQLDRIAVGVGPGTFTGLRIGIATARALARAREIPLVGVSTLESLSLNASAEDHVDAVAAVLDARRGEVFVAAWEAGAERRQLLAPVAIAPEQLADRLSTLAPRTLAIGEGAVEFRAILERPGVLIPEDHSELHRVTCVRHCRLASSLEPGDPDEVRPAYLRLPDAELNRRAAMKS